jgi:hypothetical protein
LNISGCSCYPDQRGEVRRGGVNIAANQASAFVVDASISLAVRHPFSTPLSPTTKP